MKLLATLLAAAAFAAPAPQGDDAGHAPAAPAAPVDIITPHITDSYHMELPYWAPPFYREVCLGRHVGEHGCEPLWEPMHIGAFEVNLSPTKHVVMLFVAATLCVLVLVSAAVSHARQSRKRGHPKRFGSGIEALVLYLRNEVILPNVGHHGEAFVPFSLTLFFFIFAANVLGLVPYGSTATGNIAVTATLALITFFVVEIAGMKANGIGYLNTIFYWNKDLPLAMRIPMFIIMSPVEVIGKLTKPFALAIRLFANMTAGHIVVLALIGLIFSFGSWFVAGAPVLMAVAIMMLELFVALLQAYIFTLLASVFIGLVRSGAH
jgi:F-type H+-transporting ATPase subunit a